MDVNSQRLSYRLSQLASWNSDALLSKCILSLSVEKNTTMNDPMNGEIYNY